MLRVYAPQEKESTVSSQFAPETPDEVIREVLTNTANRVVGAYMRVAQAATTSEAKEEAKAKMHEAWRIKNDLDMGREEMIEEVHRLQGVLAALKEA